MTDFSGYESLVHEEKDGILSLSLFVPGIYCAACIQKIESTLQEKTEIKGARVNFTLRRLSIEWQGEPSLANSFVQDVENLGYEVQPYNLESEQDSDYSEERFLLLCLGVSGFAAGNVMLISFGLWGSDSQTMGMATRVFMHWVEAFIALPTILFSGRPFFRSAAKALSAGRTNMDVPISLALILAGGMSLYETAHHGEHAYFDSAVMLIFFLLIGRYLEFHARKKARSSATNLLSALRGFAVVVVGDKTKRMPVKDVTEGMILKVAAGEKFPVDGVVVDGCSDVDTSLVTGESVPRKVCVATEVYAGTINLGAPITLRVTRKAESTLLADIGRLMEQAGQKRDSYVRIADHAARLYTPVVHLCAFLAFCGWWGLGGLDWQDAMMIAVTVLIITCPCALGLAVPVVQVLASSLLMKKGILVKSGDALERLAGVDTVLFDKTGTLTLGRPVLEGVYEWEKLQLAASLAVHSKHPLSQAVVRAHRGALLEVGEIQEFAGCGLSGVYDGKLIRLGNRSWCGKESKMVTEQSEIWLSEMDSDPTVFLFSDRLKDDAVQTIGKLQEQGLYIAMLSGDRRNVATHVSKICGISHVYAEMSPTQKYDVLATLHAKGHKILMVGDGLNDAPVLAASDVSMAPGTAIDLAQNTADIVFMGDHLAPVYETHRIAKRVRKLVRQNFTLAIAYNLIAIPMALAGMVTPFLAALAMSGSSLVVIVNSFRLRTVA